MMQWFLSSNAVMKMIAYFVPSRVYAAMARVLDDMINFGNDVMSEEPRMTRKKINCYPPTYKKKYREQDSSTD